AHDSTLDNFPSRDEIEQNQMNLAGDYQISFALFRLSALWFSVNDADNATSIIQELEEQFPSHKPGNEFTQAANIFYDQIVEGKNFKSACGAVSLFLKDKYANLNIHIGDWGVSVVTYTELYELCPFH